MLTRTFSLIAVVVLAVAGLAGCGGAKYLIKGLELPPGSVEVEVDSSFHSGLPGMPPPVAGKIKKSIGVMFNCGGGWSAVTGHFDSFLRGRGFEDNMAEMDKMSGSIPGMGNIRFSDMMRVYVDTDAKYGVAILNNQKLADLGKMTGSPQDFGVADFTMSVVEIE